MMPSTDVAIVGAGVVGCAIVRRLALGGVRCVLLEKGTDILSGASKGNSALLHTGFDAPPGSLELQCMQAGYAEYLQVRERLNLPLVETGAVVVAWTEAERERLAGIVAQAHANGVTDVREIAPRELYAREPNLAPGALGAALVPGEHVIDPWSAPLAYVLQALAHGAQVRRGCEVTAGQLDDAGWTLTTGAGEIRARIVINAAGLYGDLIENLAHPSPFAIRPRKGQFVVFDKPAYRLVRSIILPVPNERTKGVVLTRTAFGNVLVGPTAEEAQERDHACGGRGHAAQPGRQGGGAGARAGEPLGQRRLRGPAAGHAVQGLPDRGTAGASLDHRGRHPLHRAHRRARHRAARGAIYTPRISAP